MITRRTLVAATLSTAAAKAAPASAQTFPARPVRVTMPFPAGTGPDVVQRAINEKLNQRWGQPVIVDNRPGGNGWIAVDAVKRATPDGYTILQTDNLQFGLQPFVFSRLPFEVQDFEPVAGLYQTYFFLTVVANSPWTSVADLVAAARARNGNMTFGSSGVASHMHLGGVMLEGAHGMRMTHVPFRDTPQVFVSIASGQLDWAFGTPATTGPIYHAQRVKYLAISGPTRHPNFPDVPTVREAGGPPDFDLKSWVGLFAPRGTPRAIIERLNGEVTQVLADPDVRARLSTLGVLPWPATAEQVAQTMRDDQRVFGEIAQRERISLD
jgi:tripartite-type tricarboxylate transporter receptor subunit TctC